MSSPREPQELTDRERKFIVDVLEQWSLSAAHAPFPYQIFGLRNGAEFEELTCRLQRAVKDREPLSDADWARTLLLTEITWASDLVGSGIDFACVTSFSDDEAVAILRSLQHPRKLGRFAQSGIRELFPHGGRDLPPLTLGRTGAPDDDDA